MNTLLALLYLLLSLFGVDARRGTEALCDYTLLPGVCRIVPTVQPPTHEKAPAPGRGLLSTEAAAYSELRITAAITPVATETST